MELDKDYKIKELKVFYYYRVNLNRQKFYEYSKEHGRCNYNVDERIGYFKGRSEVYESILNKKAIASYFRGFLSDHKCDFNLGMLSNEEVIEYIVSSNIDDEYQGDYGGDSNE